MIAAAVALVAVAGPAEAREDQWNARRMGQLAREARAAAADGLDPAWYGSGTGMTPPTAEASALRLASDLARGRVRDRAAHSWYIESTAPGDLDLSQGLARALDEDDLGGWLRTLRPSDPSYEVLRHRLAETRDPVARQRLRANLERWRWMPRDLPTGERIVVNVPTYRLSYVRSDGSVQSHDVIVGAPRTPTPQLMTDATSVVVNPPWNVPASIARGLRAGRKYRAIRTEGGGRRLRQAPGPGNALGQYKIEMPNPHAIYLHDTPAKGLFARETRAFSHGCIRVKGVADLAAELAGTADEPHDLSDIVATRRTRWLELGRRIPVMIVYFTSEVQDDGTVTSYPDIYGRDIRLAKALEQ
jgi:murein L,D-transpeptidase YcbB/YkuD